jgi:hypothetical protein
MGNETLLELFDALIAATVHLLLEILEEALHNSINLQDFLFAAEKDKFACSQK